ncbi:MULTISPECIES: hypothetical protein [Pantoea]|uniref:hypothetical protein n=1 Tax=Pantoea TaxID=53335 RepID=UPI001F28CC90|nr:MULTISPECIES: hypothetical protein [Pantoea]UIL51494.1 hypothetical protein LZU96_14825 [Pantoea agglomerans]
MSFSRRRGGDNNRAFTVGISDITGIREDYHRLRLLENAVINYGGGRRALETRVRDTARRMRNVDSEAAALLYDVTAYLRDVAIAGELDEEDCFGLRAHRGVSFS